MLRRTMSEIDVKAGVENILKRMNVAFESRPKTIKAPKPQLVAVSKTKPVEMIIDAYNIGQRHFGENYVQELIEKSNDAKLLESCPEIRWHFIGHLQNNKVNKILKVPNLYMVQTVDNEKLAATLNNAWEKVQMENKSPLRVLIQINTSGEEAKNGVHPSEAPNFFRYIRDNFINLQIEGIMTIGAFGHDYTTGPNPDFISLMSVHRTICEDNDLEPSTIHVSMGMSDDFEKAIEMGSTIVRIGSSIFGYRAKKNA